MSLPREGSRDTDEGIIVSLTPDVCKTPVGNAMPPIPYSITAKQGDDANTVATVRMTNKRAHNMSSLVTKSTGDSPGTGTGIKSGTVGSVCHPKTHSSNVRIKGDWAIRHTDQWEMNNRNTIGKLTYMQSTEAFAETPAVLGYREGPQEAEILLAELQLPGETVVDIPPIGQGGQLPAPTGGGELPAPTGGGQLPAPPPEPGVPTPDNPRPGLGTRIWRGLGRSPVIAEEVVNAITDGGVARAQIDGMIGELEHYRDHYAAEGYSPDDLAQYDNSIREMEAIRDATTNENARESLGRATELKDEAQQDWLDLELGQADVRVTGEEGDPCRVGPYSEMRAVCAAQGMQAHHIVPDYALRYGTRSQGQAGLKRIPDMPSFDDGNAICLEGNARVPGTQHNIAHTITDGRIERFSNAANNPIPGTTTLGRAMRASIEGASQGKGGCRAEITAAVNEQFSGVDQNRLVRASVYTLPSGPALTALSPNN